MRLVAEGNWVRLASRPKRIDTPGLNGLLASSPAGEQRRKMIATVTPVGRLGTADEIAAAAVFFASDDVPAASPEPNCSSMAVLV